MVDEKNTKIGQILTQGKCDKLHKIVSSRINWKTKSQAVIKAINSWFESADNSIKRYEDDINTLVSLRAKIAKKTSFIMEIEGPNPKQLPYTKLKDELLAEDFQTLLNLFYFMDSDILIKDSVKEINKCITEFKNSLEKTTKDKSLIQEISQEIHQKA